VRRAIAVYLAVKFGVVVEMEGAEITSVVLAPDGSAHVVLHKNSPLFTRPTESEMH